MTIVTDILKQMPAFRQPPTEIPCWPVGWRVNWSMAVLEIDVDDKAFCAAFTTGQVHDEDVDEWRGDVEYTPKPA